MALYLSRKGATGYYVPSGREPYTYLNSLLDSNYPLARRIGGLAQSRIDALADNIQIHGLTRSNSPKLSHRTALDFLKEVANKQRSHEVAYIQARIKDIQSLGPVGTEEQKIIESFNQMLDSPETFNYKIFINTFNTVISTLQKYITRVKGLLNKKNISMPQVNLVEQLEATLDDFSEQRQKFVYAQEEIIRQLTMEFFTNGAGAEFISEQALNSINGATNIAAAIAIVQQQLAQYVYDKQLLTYFKNGNKDSYTHKEFVDIIKQLESANILEDFTMESNITAVFHNDQLLKDTAKLYGIEMVDQSKNRNSREARAAQKALRKVKSDLENDPFINNNKLKQLCSRVRVTWKPGNRGISLHNELLGGMRKGVTNSIHLGNLNIGTDAMLVYGQADGIQQGLQHLRDTLKSNQDDLHDAKTVSKIYLDELTALDEKLEGIQKSFILHETVKNYTTLEQGKFGFRDAFEGRVMKLEHYINAISQMYAQFVDTRWLEFALYNLATDALGSILANPLQTYLAIYGGMIMFDDFAVIGREITNNLSFSNIENLHLYRLQDIYAPASVFLDATYKALANEADTLLNDNEFSVAIEGIPTINYEKNRLQYGATFSERWGNVRDKSNDIQVKLMFGANFLSMMQSLL